MLGRRSPNTLMSIRCVQALYSSRTIFLSSTAEPLHIASLHRSPQTEQFRRCLLRHRRGLLAVFSAKKHFIVLRSVSRAVRGPRYAEFSRETANCARACIAPNVPSAITIQPQLRPPGMPARKRATAVIGSSLYNRLRRCSPDFL
jgi:hypothetical protein